VLHEIHRSRRSLVDRFEVLNMLFENVVFVVSCNRARVCDAHVEVRRVMMLPAGAYDISVIRRSGDGYGSRGPGIDMTKCERHGLQLVVTESIFIDNGVIMSRA